MDAKNFLKAIERRAIVAYTNRSGIIEYVNSNFCHISGYSKEELIGQDHQIVNSGYHSKEFIKSIWSTILAGEVWCGDICNRAKDGSIYWVNSTISPSIVAGEIVGFYAVRNDITHQKELEKHNIELIRLSNELQEIAHIGGWSYFPDSKSFIITDQIRTILSLPSDLEITPQDIDELTPNKNTVLFSRLIKTVSDQKENITKEYKMISLKGSIVFIKISASTVRDDRGAIVKIAGTFHNITSLKEAQEQTQLEREKSMHSAKLASIGEMASSVVHEINNPLASIQAAVQSILKRSTDEDTKMRLERVRPSIKKLTRLADNLRQYSRGNQIKTEFKVHELRNIIEKSLFVLEHRFNYSNIELTLEVEEGLNIKCDHSQIEQVVVNLVNNSIDSIEKLKTRWIKIEGFENEDKIYLQVTDSGGGIPKNIQDKIFKTFFTTKSEDKGTGLGLGIVIDILSKHNATIKVDDESPFTKFIIEFLPLGKELSNK